MTAAPADRWADAPAPPPGRSYVLLVEGDGRPRIVLATSDAAAADEVAARFVAAGEDARARHGGPAPVAEDLARIDEETA